MACSDMLDLLVTCEGRTREVEFSKQDASYEKLLEKLAEEFEDVLLQKGPISHLEIYKERWGKFVELKPRKVASDVNDGSELRVILKNDEAAESTDGNSSTDLPELVPYCTEPLGDESTAGAGDSGGQEGSAAYALESKLWIGRDRLKVFFLNPEFLKNNDWRCGKSGQLNVSNILGWAEAWNPPNCPDIPDFKQTDREGEADIRIKFADGGCWSRVGRDAEQVVDKSKPTMVLSLKGSPESEQKFLVRHEFGHALGLFHEHQRYDFWGPASTLLDKAKMKRDHRMRNVNFDRDIFAKGAGDIKTEYDADSVMHYWFDVNWLKDSKHKARDYNIESDNSLTEPQKMILGGIRTRNLSHPSGPSAKDLAFLQQHYSSSSQPAAGFLPSAPAGGTPSLQPAPAQPSQRKSVTIESLKREYRLSDHDLDKKLEGGDTIMLARDFDSVKFYYKLSIMCLSQAEQIDIEGTANNQLAMDKCLSLWKQHNPSTATYRNLLEILIKQDKREIAAKVCSYYCSTYKQ